MSRATIGCLCLWIVLGACDDTTTLGTPSDDASDDASEDVSNVDDAANSTDATPADTSALDIFDMVDFTDASAEDAPQEDASDSATSSDDTADLSTEDVPVIEPPDPNEGWIGGPCESPNDCTVADALCLVEAAGYPGGLCSQACDLYCPDQEGNSGTFCLETPEGGRCVGRCDWNFYPDHGCREGYTCRIMPRNQEPSTRAEVCVRDTHPDYAALTGCYAELDARGLVWGHWNYTTQSPSGAPNVTCTVNEPIRLSGQSVNGVTYRPYNQETASPMAMTCSLALALYDLSETLHGDQITDVLHIGTFNCRFISGTTTLSRHAYGDAIDIYGFVDAAGQDYTLIRDWEHDTTDPISFAAQLLYDIAQRMYLEDIFHIILTPNYNAAHDNHFHVDLTPNSHYLKAASSPTPLGD